MDVKTGTLELERLEQLYAAGLQDNFVDEALRKIVARQVERDEMDLGEIETILVEYESMFGMRSEEFSEKFAAGQMEDTGDVMAWNAAYKSRERLRTRLRILKSEDGGND